MCDKRERLDGCSPSFDVAQVADRRVARLATTVVDQVPLSAGSVSAVIDPYSWTGGPISAGVDPSDDLK